MFVHVVNFWLKKGLSSDDIKKFEAGVSSLAEIETVDVFSVGKPANTDRPVIDRSYDYCASLWEKVLIYDSESI